MINVSVNGEELTLAAHTTVSALLEQQQFGLDRVAVAVNTEFVPRSCWRERVLKASDKVDVVTAVQGG